MSWEPLYDAVRDFIAPSGVPMQQQEAGLLSASLGHFYSDTGTDPQGAGSYTPAVLEELQPLYSRARSQAGLVVDLMPNGG